MMKSSKYSYHLLGIFFIVSFVFLVLIFLGKSNSRKVIVTPTPSPTLIPTSTIAMTDTSRWNTYSNSLWSFKYPEEWVAVDCKIKDYVSLGPKLRKGQEIACGTEYPHPNFTILISRDPSNSVPYEDIYKKPTDRLRVERKNIVVGNKTGFIQTLIFNRGTEEQALSRYIYIVHDNVVDSIIYPEEDYATLQQILATITFK